ncbi:MAG: PEP-utilizing enzyme [Candidatus Nanoarchaeia archaeon]
MKETKATRLKTLSHVVPVPEFFIIKNKELLPTLDKNHKYMVRSSTKNEDQKKSSQAGISTTLGPINEREVNKAVKKIFSNKPDCEIIIQKYAKGTSGVAFCFSKNKIYTEYSGLFEGVTSGKAHPFVAVMPTKIKKYQKLQKNLQKIYQKFGPCDIEFVGIQDPLFVQVRPITKDFSIDSSHNILMELQEKGKNWQENEFCKMLPERIYNPKAFASLYLKALERFHNDFSKKQIKIPNESLIKIGEQYFIDEYILSQAKLSFTGIIRLVLYWLRQKESIKKNTPKEPQEAMYKSIILSTLYELVKTKELISLREKYRKQINKLISKKEKKIEKIKILQFSTNKKLNSQLRLNKNKKIWLTNPFSAEEGITVISGMPRGPYQIINKSGEKIKEGHVIVTPQLYPELGEKIKQLKGIISEGGALTSHVSILAREYSVPLIIQMDKAREKFDKKT